MLDEDRNDHDASSPPRPFRSRRRGTPGGRRPILVIAAVALALVGASACDPLLHPVVRTVATFDDPVTLQLMSGDGSTVVVRATAAGGTVPGPGWWTVDRSSGAATELVGVTAATRISNDGQRVLVSTAAGTRIWNQGTLVALPFGVRMSDELRYGALIDVFARHVRRWEMATNTLLDIDGLHPRPPTHPTVGPSPGIGTSDDGSVVWYQLSGPGGCIVRFVNLALDRVDDIPLCSTMIVAANGSSFVRLLDPVVFGAPYFTVGGPTRLELVSTFTHEVTQTLVPQFGGWFDGVVLADTGWNLWTVETTGQGTLTPPECGTIGKPPCDATLTARDLIAASHNEVVHRPVDPSLARWNHTDPVPFVTNAGGRFLVYRVAEAGGAIHVVDRLTDADEEIVLGGANAPALPMVSDDGTLLTFAQHPAYYPQTNNWRGWFEAETAPAAPGIAAP